MRDTQLAHGVAKTLVYDGTLYIMAGLLLIGLLCNLFVRPVAEKNYMTDEQLAHERSLQHEDRVTADAVTAARGGFGGARRRGLAGSGRSVPDRTLYRPRQGGGAVLTRRRRPARRRPPA